MKWWRDGRFGMFIHWGIYSAAGGSWNGKKISGMGEWIMCMGRIPIAGYTDFARTFNPVDFNADTWVHIAKDAGMKYMVITAKHHDGFAMFDTKFSPRNIVTGTAYGKDPLKALAKSCAANDVSLGFYYSQALDWTNGGALSTLPWDSAQGTPIPDYIDHVVLPQLRELLTNYGDAPKVIWWDWASRIDKIQSQKIFNEVRSVRPDVILNNRLWGVPTDFDVQESSLPFHAPTDNGKPRDWETCMTLNDTWGYRADDTNWKSTQTLLRMLCDINSKGGNFMLNIGPDGMGDFPPGCLDRLKQIGAWMRVNGEAIYGTQAGPFPHPFPWGRIGRKGETINFFVFNWPADGHLRVPLAGKVIKASVLGFPQMTVSNSTSDNGLDLVLPRAAPNEPVAVVALTFESEPQALPCVVQPGPDGSIKLSVADADIEGKGTLSMTMDEPPVMQNWRKENVAPVWTIAVPKAGKYAVSLIYACDASKAGSDFQFILGTNTLAGKVEASKGRDDFSAFNVGTIQIDGTAPQTVKLQPTHVAQDDFLHLREIDLNPVP